MGVLAPLSDHSGNRSTALRIQALLKAPDCECLIFSVSGKAAVSAAPVKGKEGGREKSRHLIGEGKRERYDSGGPAEENPLSGEKSVASWATTHGVEVLVALHA